MSDGPLLHEHQLAATTDSVGTARQRVDALLRSHGVDTSVRERVAVVVSELVTNAVEASEDPFELSLRLDAGARTATVTVANRAPRTSLGPEHAWGPDDVLAPRGRGLLIVQRLADDFRVLEDDRVVRVRAVFDLQTKRT